MTVLHGFAILAAIFVLAKVITISIKQEAWLEGVVKKLWSCPPVLVVGNSLVAGAVILYFLLQELTIVDIWAVFSLAFVLVIAGFAPFARDLTPFAEKVYREKGLMKRAWLIFAIWSGLAIWLLVAVFF